MTTRIKYTKIPGLHAPYDLDDLGEECSGKMTVDFLKFTRRETEELKELDRLQEKAVDTFMELIFKSAKTAVEKDHVSELTRQEAFAIAVLGGASWSFEEGQLRTEECGMFKDEDGRWRVLLYGR